jgi:hypothetical protein
LRSSAHGASANKQQEDENIPVSEHKYRPFSRQTPVGVTRCSVEATQQVEIVTHRSATLSRNLLSTWQNADEYIPISLLKVVFPAIGPNSRELSEQSTTVRQNPLSLATVGSGGIPAARARLRHNQDHRILQFSLTQ